MTDFSWTGNAQQMWEASLKAAPLPFRAVTKKSLTKNLVAMVGDGGEVGEADIVRVIKQATPAPFVAQGLKAVEPFLSDPSILT